MTTISTQDFSVNIAGATIFGVSDDYIQISYGGEDITFTPPSTGIPTTVAIDPHIITLPIGGFGEYLENI